MYLILFNGECMCSIDDYCKEIKRWVLEERTIPLQGTVAVHEIEYTVIGKIYYSFVGTWVGCFK